jgi:hypothetical protein
MVLVSILLGAMEKKVLSLIIDKQKEIPEKEEEVMLISMKNSIESRYILFFSKVFTSHLYKQVV